MENNKIFIDWVILGDIYPTADKAAEVLGVTSMTIRRRVASKIPGYQKVIRESQVNPQKYWWYAEGVKYCTAQDAADTLGVNPATIYNRIVKNELGYFKTNLLGAPVPLRNVIRKHKHWWVAEGKRYRTAQAVADAFGITVLTIYNRVKSGRYFKADFDTPWFLD